jgi:hypothetical protein
MNTEQHSLTISQTLHGSVKVLFQKLYTRRITNPKQVINMIGMPSMKDDEVLPLVDGQEGTEVGLQYNGSSLRLLGERFMLHLKRYLHGRGHPNHPIYNSLVSTEDRDAANTDPGFRARQFLQCMSSLAFLPITEETLEVCHSCVHILNDVELFLGMLHMPQRIYEACRCPK